MPRYLSLSEIFEQNKKLTKSAERTTWLKKNASAPLYFVLWLAFNDSVEWLLPAEDPEFVPYGSRNRHYHVGSEPTDVRNELKRIYLFLKGGPNIGPGGDHVRPEKRQKLFLDILESLSAAEVKLLLSLKNKTFSKEYRLSRVLLDETFPGLVDAPFRLRFMRR